MRSKIGAPEYGVHLSASRAPRRAGVRIDENHAALSVRLDEINQRLLSAPRKSKRGCEIATSRHSSSARAERVGPRACEA